MHISLKPAILALCLAGLIVQPVLAATDEETIEKLSSQVAQLQKELNSLKSELKPQPRLLNSIYTNQNSSGNSLRKSKTSKNHYHDPDANVHTRSKPPAALEATQQTLITPQTEGQSDATRLTGQDLIRLIGESQTYLPFDLDVPGQAFVSTGPYVGVPVQYSGSNLIINSPSVNTDVQLLGIRKHIHEQLTLMGGTLFKEPYHSHLLLSGVVEVQAFYLKRSGKASTSDIDVTNVSFDAFFIGPSDWLLGFIEFSFDNGNGPEPARTRRIFNSRVFVNKAFITIGDLQKSPFYLTFGQFYVPFGTFSSLMISDTLPKLLGRTKARAIEVGFQQQCTNALYGAIYAFRGDAHHRANRINNGGVNLGGKFQIGWFSGNVGGGFIGDLADSGGMQLGNGFARHEKIAHPVPAYNVRGLFNIGKKVDIILEFISAINHFNHHDMSFGDHVNRFNTFLRRHGARPWASDAQIAYSFYILNDRPSAIGLGYGHSHDALSLGIPLSRTSVVFNTSLWRNTLQSVEFRHDKNYARSIRANGPIVDRNKPFACTAIQCSTSNKSDNAVTVQFDYFF